MRGGRGAHRKQLPSGARGTVRAAMRAVARAATATAMPVVAGSQLHQDCRRQWWRRQHWEAAERESTRRTRADGPVSQAMVGQRIGSRVASGGHGGGGGRCGQGGAAAQQTYLLRAAVKVGCSRSNTEAVGTGRQRRWPKPVSDQKIVLLEERGPRGRLLHGEPPREAFVHGLGAGG
eukprot:6587388-Prymnesium_polylepis.1